MPETTVGLPDNNLFGNLIANTRLSVNNPGSQTLNINSIQSDTKAEDLGKKKICHSRKYLDNIYDSVE